MKILAMAMAAVLAGGSGLAMAQDRDGRRDGVRDGDWQRGDRDGRRHWDGHRDGRPHWGGHHHGGHDRHYAYPRYGYYSHPRPYGYYGWARPYGYVYGPPLYSYAPGSFYTYPAPPVIVERVYEEPVVVERVYKEPVAVEPPRYEERSYAQVAPRETRPAPTPAEPAPRLERYTLSATELFEFDKATLRTPQPKLDEIAEVMRREPRIDNVTITGYTDRLGTDAYNLKLSQRRAEAVKAYLVGKGVEAARLKAVGKGEANPVVQCNDRDRAALIRCLEPNRRVEVEQISVTRQVPATRR